MLLDSLMDGNVKLSQAHLIVVSDAQRIILMNISHPILRIMTDFYAKILDGPRIFATVTSAPERWASLDLTRLEIAFRAQSFFLATKAADSWYGPLELVVEYDKYNPQEADDELTSRVRDTDPGGLLLRSKHFRTARRILQELGLLAVDLYWKHVLDELCSSTTDGDESDLRKKLSQLRASLPNRTLVATYGSSSCNASPKLAKLLEVLSAYEGHGTDFRGIVFTRDRGVARILAEILGLPHAGLSFIRPIAFYQRKSNEANHELELYRAFEEGRHNLPVLTRCNEDVEIPQASTIISFNLFEDHLTYAYCHARSKGRHSHLVHMIERGNNEQRRVLNHVETIDADLRGWIAGFAQGSTNAIPPRSLYMSLDPRVDDGAEGEDQEYMLDPTTSACLYKPDAEAAFYRFVATFEQQAVWNQGTSSISLEENDSTRYRCTVTPPKGIGIPDIVGPSCFTKAQAKREALYRACQECVRMGYMDYRHFPQPPWYSDDPHSEARGSAQEVQTANTSAGTHGYPRKSPDFWANSSKYPVSTLYPTVVVPDSLGGESHAPVVILTRAPLPQIPNFLLFFAGARATAHFYKGAPFEASPVQLQALRGYTIRVVRSLTNKPFDCPAESLLCFFAPLAPSWQPLSGAPGFLGAQLRVGEHIPWDSVQLTADYFAVPLWSSLTSLDDSARDAVVQDRNVEFTMRHFLVKVRHDLTPLSKVDDSPREAEYPNFLEYCKARRKDFEGLEDEKQPMIEVSAVPGVLNNLHPMSAPQTPPAKAPLKYLIPELTYKFTIPASTFRTLWLIPSIMTRIDSYLLVKELDARLFHLSIHEQQLLVALSTRAAWTESNYERLEFLGDAFLKVVASNFLYVTMPSAGEGALHNARQGIIGNKILHECATRVGICPYIQHKRFVPKLWQPPHTPDAPPTGAQSQQQQHQSREAAKDGEDVDEDVEMADAESSESNGPKGKQKRSKKQRQMDGQNTLWMGDKARYPTDAQHIVADVVEAILAAAFLSGGHEVALRAAKRLHIPLPNVAQWTDFARIAAEHPTAQHAHPSVVDLRPDTVEAVQTVVGAIFSRPALLAQALTHGSAFGGTEGASYERLEFIGDAVLDFLVARHIFERHPHLSPGGLTLLKGAMVSNRALAAFCVHAGLHRHLVHSSDQLANAIAKYVEALEARRAREYELATRENRLPGQYWLDLPMEPPKCLSDVVESVIGALYVCDSFFEVGVGRFFDAVFKPFMDAHVRLQTLSANPKVTLLELLQAEGCQQHAVVKIPQERQNAPVHMEGECMHAVQIHGQVVASATDLSAAIATRKVSLAALDALANDPELLARICDCGSGESKKQHQRQQSSIKSDEVMQDEEAEAAEVEEAMEAIEEGEL
ncbi:ribonuclease III [Cubamyces lactineus]|nr:ribonuclease III [Cubamyces lactineus]